MLSLHAPKKLAEIADKCARFRLIWTVCRRKDGDHLLLLTALEAELQIRLVLAVSGGGGWTDSELLHTTRLLPLLVQLMQQPPLLLVGSSGQQKGRTS